MISKRIICVKWIFCGHRFRHIYIYIEKMIDETHTATNAIAAPAYISEKMNPTARPTEITIGRYFLSWPSMWGVNISPFVTYWNIIGSIGKNYNYN